MKPLNCQHGSIEAVILIPNDDAGLMADSKVTGVNIDIDGIANAVHNTQIPVHNFYNNTKSFYLNNTRKSMTPSEFYTASVIY